jgi:ADP-ribose pyrophosphatase
MTNSIAQSKEVLQFSTKDVSVSQLKTNYQGFFKLNEYQLSHKLFSGGQSANIKREIFERGDAVVVLPYDVKQDKLLLIEQFRPGALRASASMKNGSPWQLEFIAGMFDKGESPTEVAIREAKEEANIDIEVSNLIPIMQYLSSPGGMSECIHLYIALIDSEQVDAGSVHGLDEEDEDILLHIVSKDDALALLAQGKITNAATLIGLQWLALNYQTLSKALSDNAKQYSSQR